MLEFWGAIAWDLVTSDWFWKVDKISRWIWVVDLVGWGLFCLLAAISLDSELWAVVNEKSSFCLWICKLDGVVSELIWLDDAISLDSEVSDWVGDPERLSLWISVEDFAETGIDSEALGIFVLELVRLSDAIALSSELLSESSARSLLFLWIWVLERLGFNADSNVWDLVDDKSRFCLWIGEFDRVESELLGFWDAIALSSELFVKTADKSLLSRWISVLEVSDIVDVDSKFCFWIEGLGVVEWELFSWLVAIALDSELWGVVNEESNSCLWIEELGVVESELVRLFVAIALSSELLSESSARSLLFLWIWVLERLGFNADSNVWDLVDDKSRFCLWIGEFDRVKSELLGFWDAIALSSKLFVETADTSLLSRWISVLEVLDIVDVGSKFCFWIEELDGVVLELIWLDDAISFDSRVSDWVDDVERVSRWISVGELLRFNADSDVWDLVDEEFRFCLLIGELDRVVSELLELLAVIAWDLVTSDWFCDVDKISRWIWVGELAGLGLFWLLVEIASLSELLLETADTSLLSLWIWVLWWWKFDVNSDVWDKVDDESRFCLWIGESDLFESEWFRSSIAIASSWELWVDTTDKSLLSFWIWVLGWWEVVDDKSRFSLWIGKLGLVGLESVWLDGAIAFCVATSDLVVDWDGISLWIPLVEWFGFDVDSDVWDKVDAESGFCLWIDELDEVVWKLFRFSSAISSDVKTLDCVVDAERISFWTSVLELSGFSSDCDIEEVVDDESRFSFWIGELDKFELVIWDWFCDLERIFLWILVLESLRFDVDSNVLDETDNESKLFLWICELDRVVSELLELLLAIAFDSVTSDWVGDWDKISLWIPLVEWLEFDLDSEILNEVNGKSKFSSWIKESAGFEVLLALVSDADRISRWISEEDLFGFELFLPPVTILKKAASLCASAKDCWVEFSDKLLLFLWMWVSDLWLFDDDFELLNMFDGETLVSLWIWELDWGVWDFIERSLVIILGSVTSDLFDEPGIVSVCFIEVIRSFFCWIMDFNLGVLVCFLRLDLFFSRAGSIFLTDNLLFWGANFLGIFV